MNIGFIGTGNMANAILGGITQSGIVASQNINVFDIDNIKLKQCAEKYHATAVGSAQELVEKSDVVILAVKPIVFPTLLPQLSSVLSAKNPLIISIAAGKTIEYMTSLLNDDPSLVRVMPNINAKVGASMSAYCTNGNVTQEQEDAVKNIFSSVGRILPLDEAYFPLFGVIAGSAPAFAYMFIDAIARAAVKNGMNKKLALEIAAQTVFGSAQLILNTQEHPWELIDQVCSPGGTTIEGIASLQADGFAAAVDKAVTKSLEKDNKI